MIDQIKNKSLSSGADNTRKIAQNEQNTAKSSVQKVQNPSKSQVDAHDGKVSQFISKEKVKSMSKEPPIDRVSTTRIKEAIQNGTYPIDMTKIADALFDAIKEMK
ncbi:MAG: flagellar biosynthesis anti-sigma factor FlgM [Alphaproteobacteria bacterium]|tara:strand:+ start:643 stop:957 length:315 start_codon:yes stop_codon:yes gene_type:complete